MHGKESKLETARRHVQEGGIHLARQRRILAKLRANGHPTGIAEQLLATLEQAQRQHEAHLARLECDRPAAEAGHDDL